MAYQLLPGTKLKDGRYQVIKTASWRTTGGTYEAWDISVTEKRYIIKEVMPPKMTENELEQRRQFFLETMEMLINLEHPNLADITDCFEDHGRFYMVVEHIEGITIENFLGVIEKLPEKQVLKIGLKLCDAISLLWNRPRPISFENLDLEHIMVDFDKNLKFMGYDLTYYFYGDFPPRLFSNAPEVMESSIYKLSKILFFLLTGKKDIPPERIPENTHISQGLRKLLYITLNPSQKSYSSINKFRDELEKILDPDKYEEKTELDANRLKKFFSDLPSFRWLTHIPVRMFMTFRNQKVWIIVVEIVAIVFLASFLFFSKKAHVSVYEKPEGVPLYYISGENEIITIRGDDFSIINRIESNGKFAGSAILNKDGNEYLLVTDSKNNSLLVFDTKNNKLTKIIALDEDPEKIVVKEENNSVFILHPKAGNVTFIDGKTFSITGFLPSGRGAVDMCYSSRNKTLFITDWLPQDIIQLDPVKRVIKKKNKIPAQPGIITISQDGSTLCVHNRKNGNILVYNLSNGLSKEDVIEAKGMGEPSSYLWDKKPNRLWITFEESNRLVLYDLKDKKIVHNFLVEKEPAKVLMDKKSKKLLVITAGARELLVLDPDTGGMEGKVQLDKTPSDIVVSE